MNEPSEPTPDSAVVWVQGRPAAAWWAGFFGLSFGALLVVEIVLDLVLLPHGYTRSQSEELAAGLGLPAMAAVGVLWLIYVPFPLEWIGLTPGGIRIRLGLRQERFGWAQLLLVEERLYVAPPHAGPVGRYRLVPAQVTQLRGFLHRE